MLVWSVQVGCRRSQEAAQNPSAGISIAQEINVHGDSAPVASSGPKDSNECLTPDMGQAKDPVETIKVSLDQFDTLVHLRQAQIDSAPDSLRVKMFDNDVSWVEDSVLPHFSGVYGDLVSKAGNSGGEEKDLSPKLRGQILRLKKSGFRIQYQCEGTAELQLRPEWALQTFGKGLPEEYRSYLAIDAADQTDLLDCDAGFTISFDSIADRAIAWDEWARRHPNSPRSKAAIRRARYYQRDLLLGEANTPVFGDSGLDSSIRVLWKSVIRKHPRTSTAKTLAKALGMLEAANWHQPDGYEEWINPTKRPCTFEGDTL